MLFVFIFLISLAFHDLTYAENENAQNYLQTNFEVSFPLEKILHVSKNFVCDQKAPVKPSKNLFGDIETTQIVCSGDKETSRIVVGWSNNSRYMTVNKMLGNLQLEYRNKEHSGALNCKESTQYMKLDDVVMGSSCVMITDINKKIAFSVFFKKTPTIKGGKLFIAIMDINTETDANEYENTLIGLLAK